MMFFGARPVSSAARCNTGRCSNEVKTINTPRPIVDDMLCVRLKGRDLVISTYSSQAFDDEDQAAAGAKPKTRTR